MGWRRNYYSTPSVAEQRQQAENRLKKLRKKYPDIQPMQIDGNKIAKTWWGKSWCENLERYADFENRIGRGRSYVKNGLVLDLSIAAGVIQAMVSGKNVYHVTIVVSELPEKKWQKVAKLCARQIDSMAALAEGSFPQELAEVFMRQGDGLFPSPKEIHLSCDCPDWAMMCKHVAATLYAVGARLDDDPLLFFVLRGIDPTELIQKSIEERMYTMLANARKKPKRAIPDNIAERIFADFL